MKDYLLFAGYEYYPSGGWNDFRGDFDSIDEAESVGSELTKGPFSCDWFHIVYSHKKDIIKEGT